MYQREAMWMRFNSQEKCAAKIYVGGINALTGLKREGRTTQQDYICLGSRNSQQSVTISIYI